MASTRRSGLRRPRLLFAVPDFFEAGVDSAYINSLTGTGNSLTGDTRFSVVTDAAGRFTMSLPASGDRDYNLVAHDGKYGERRIWAIGVLPPFFRPHAHRDRRNVDQQNEWQPLVQLVEVRQVIAEKIRRPKRRQRAQHLSLFLAREAVCLEIREAPVSIAEVRPASGGAPV